MDVGTSLVAHLEPSKLIEPGERTLDHPADTSEPLAAVLAAPGNARDDVSQTQGAATNRVIVAFVSVHLLGTKARRPGSASVDQRDSIDDCEKAFAVVNVGPREKNRQRGSSGIYRKMAFRALFASIRRIWPGFLVAPFLASGAGTEAESTQARDQSS